MWNRNRIPYSSRWSRLRVYLCVIIIVVLQSAQRSYSFVPRLIPPQPLASPCRVVPTRHHHVTAVSSYSHKSTTISLGMLPPLLTSNSIWMAMDVFDGSTIVDPVVISNVFWTSLKGKLIAVVIGQLLATVAFGVLSWLVTSQLSSLGNSLLSNMNNNNNNPRTFKKATEIPGFAATTTGTRPNNITPDFGKLFICLAIDVVGSSSEVIPFLGELTDIVYAPIAATVLRNLYGSNNILFGLEFVEEILPFTDILPLATICWVVDTYYSESDIAKLLKLGVYSPNYNTKGAIDVKANRDDDKRR